tara:strand:- start:117 stop:725 length:609 start_codon:yes stop_codon:yes gene_type:complete
MQDLPEWWSDEIEERIKNEAQATGIKDFEFVWSGFNSQGDGLSFTGKISFETWLYILQQQFPEWAKMAADKDTAGFMALGQTISSIISLHKNDKVSWGDCKIHRYNFNSCHKNAVSVIGPYFEVLASIDDCIDQVHDFVGRAQQCLNEWKNDLCCRWYDDFQKAYEVAIDRDNITEDIESNEIYFTANGTIIEADEIISQNL